MKRCTSHGKRLCWACFLQTALFPAEHLVWERFLGPLLGIAL